MTARACEATRVTGASNAIDRTRRPHEAFAWLTLVFAIWLMGAIAAAARAGDPAAFQGAVDSLSLGVLVLGVVCAAFAARAARQQRSLRQVFPPGYSVLGAGFLTLIVWEAADRGWTQGVAQLQGIEQLLAPTRVLLVIGVGLVACGPLHAVWTAANSNVPRWAAVLSAALVLVAILLPGSFAPVSNSVAGTRPGICRR